MEAARCREPVAGGEQQQRCQVPASCQVGRLRSGRFARPTRGLWQLTVPSPEHRDHLLLLVPNQPHMLSFPPRMPFLCLPPQHTAHTWPPWEPPQALARPFQWPCEGLLLGGEGTCR